MQSSSGIPNKTIPQHAHKFISRSEILALFLRLHFERALRRNMSSLSASGIESMWEEWRSKFTSALNEAVPLSVLKRSKKRKCPWMTPNLLHLLQKQKAMYRRVIRSGRRDTVAVQQHRALRNQFNNLYRQNKNMYFQEHLAEYRYAPT